MIPRLRIDSGFHGYRAVLAPAEIRTPQDDRIIQVTQPGEVSVVGIDALFLISRAQNQTGVSVLPQQLNVRFDGIILPMGGTIHQLGPTLV